MKCKILVAVFIMFISDGAIAQTREYSQQLIRTFPISNAATVDITNKYGMVRVMTWDKDSVKFTIDLHIEARDNKRLEKLKKDIDFDFTTGQYFLVARTMIGDGSSDIIQDIVDIASTYIATANKVTIDYTVFIPDYLPLQIENKYGDVYIDDLNSNLNLHLSYGELKSNELNGKTEIALNSGDADIHFIKDGQISVSYSDMRIDAVERLFIDSRSSNLTIDKGVDLRIESSRDKIFLGETGSLSGESYFTDFRIGLFTTRMSYRMRYGNLFMENVHKSFSLINLTTELTDLEIAFERPLNFNFELTHHQDIRFIYPKNVSKIVTEVINADERQMATTGTFGPASSASRVVIVASRKCDLIISSR